MNNRLVIRHDIYIWEQSQFNFFSLSFLKVFLLSRSGLISNFPNLSVTSSLFFFCIITGRSGALGRLSSTLSGTDSAFKYTSIHNVKDIHGIGKRNWQLLPINESRCERIKIKIYVLVLQAKSGQIDSTNQACL